VHAEAHKYNNSDIFPHRNLREKKVVQKRENEMRKNTQYKYIHHILHERHVAICADIWTSNGMSPQLQVVADRKSINPKLKSVRLAEMFCQAIRWQYFTHFQRRKNILCSHCTYGAYMGRGGKGKSLYSAARNEGKW
jgi:hypothetical protein